jgi:hypothetical protein
VEFTAAVVRQALGLTARQARVIIPAGRTAAFDEWDVERRFVEGVTAAQGRGPGLLPYFVTTWTGSIFLPGELRSGRRSASG